MTRQATDLFPLTEDGGCGISSQRDAVIDRYLLEEMPAAEKEAFLDHILFCPACSRELQMREGVIEALGDEPLSDMVRERARRRGEQRSGRRSWLDTGRGFPSSAWLRAAAVFLGLMVFAYGWYYLTAPPPARWAAAAALDPAGYNPQFFQDRNSRTAQAYNEGLALLFQAERREWLRPGVRYDTSLVHQAIARLQDAYAPAAPETRRMDIAFYLCKAYLMLDEPAEALSWLEKTEQLGANRAKIERAIGLCRLFESGIDGELNSSISPERRELLSGLRPHLTGLRERLGGLVSQ